MSIEVFVFSFNRGPHLEKCIDSIRHHAPKLLITVIDDYSNDEQTKLCLANSAVPVLLPPRKTKGRLGGLYSNMQFALERAKSQYALFMQDDSQFFRDLELSDIERLEDAFNKDPKLAFINPVIAMGPKGSRKVRMAKRRADYLGWEYPPRGFKPNLVRAWYSAINVCDVSRLRQATWTFGPTEEVSAQRASERFSLMLHYAPPFIAQMPEVVTLRYGTKTGAARRLYSQLNVKVNYFLPVTTSALCRMKISSLPPLAEQWLETRAPTLGRFYVHKAVNSKIFFRVLNKLEIIFRKISRLLSI